MFEKYITIKDTKILVGMYPSTGAWYCKELGADNTKELDALMADVTVVLNKHNGITKQDKTDTKK
jgi:hypothetical protein